jgi:hypothetical protein
MVGCAADVASAFGAAACVGFAAGAAVGGAGGAAGAHPTASSPAVAQIIAAFEKSSSRAIACSSFSHAIRTRSGQFVKELPSSCHASEILSG